MLIKVFLAVYLRRGNQNLRKDRRTAKENKEKRPQPFVTLGHWNCFPQSTISLHPKELTLIFEQSRQLLSESFFIHYDDLPVLLTLSLVIDCHLQISFPFLGYDIFVVALSVLLKKMEQLLNASKGTFTKSLRWQRLSVYPSASSRKSWMAVYRYLCGLRCFDSVHRPQTRPFLYLGLLSPGPEQALQNVLLHKVQRSGPLWTGHATSYILRNRCSQRHHLAVCRRSSTFGDFKLHS